METKDIPAWVSAGASVVSALGLIFTVLAIRGQSLALRLQVTAARNQYFSELRNWASEVCDTLSAALHLCDLDPTKCQAPSFFDRRHSELIKLSAQIDRGRWFFPNEMKEGVGSDKLPAFQGYRHKVLDALVAAYNLVDRLDFRHQTPNTELRKKLEACKKGFVNEIQEVLDPRGREEEFNRIAGARKG